MLKRRIIPCLDIKDGRTVKGINFVNIRDAGDPVELAKIYARQGADELVFLDITATVEQRKTLVRLVDVEDVAAIIKAGADKVSINSSAIKNPDLITAIAYRFGSQCVVVAVDTKKINEDWIVFVKGGRDITPHKTIEWTVEAEKRGAGEILLTSMNTDGTKAGFSIDITREVTQNVNIPVIASGGAGTMEHFRDVFEKTGCSAALAASVFHYSEIPIPELKQYLKSQNIEVRI